MKILTFAINRNELLLALYNNARCQGSAYDSHPEMKRRGAMAVSANLDDAKKIFAQRDSSPTKDYYFYDIDLGNGVRLLKVDLNQDEPDFSEYDRLHGKDLAETIINDLRSNIILNAFAHPDDLLAQQMKELSQQALEVEKIKKQASNPDAIWPRIRDNITGKNASYRV